MGSADRPSTILVLGLGNPILGDDGAGWRVAEAVRAELDGRYDRVEIDCAALGGLSLMERMLGYGRVILIDVMETGQSSIGHVSRFPLGALPDPTLGHTGSAHDASLATALEAARAMGAPIPAHVDVVAIEGKATYEFSEDLSPEIAAALPIATEQVLRLLDLA